MISLVCGIKKQKQKSELIDTENRLLVAIGEGECIKGVKRYRLSKYKVTKLWGCAV